MINMGIRVQMMEQACDTYRGGGVIPSVIPWLRTNSKYSRAPAKTAAAKATVKTHPPAKTTPPAAIPMPIPKIILFFNWLTFCWDSNITSCCNDKVRLPLISHKQRFSNCILLNWIKMNFKTRHTISSSTELKNTNCIKQFLLTKTKDTTSNLTFFS